VVNTSDTIRAVKKNIQNCHRLLYDEEQLEDDSTLADYGIRNYSTLKLRLGLKERMEISVNALERPLFVKGSNTIDNVKARIRDEYGIDPDKLHLKFNN
jgi:ubiquitin C